MDEPRSGAEALGLRMNFSYLLGAYLAVNAIRDCSIVVDGPDCAFFKGQFIAGSHDLFSTLYPADGPPRIVYTGTDTHTVIWDREKQIAAAADEAARTVPSGIVLVTGLPMSAIVGTHYDRIVRGRKSSRASLAVVPPRSLQGDWMDGYADALLAVAKGIRMPRVKKSKDKVALVGYFMDRTEGDHGGNLEELGNLLAALSLDLVSVWPGGGSCDDLRKAAGAGTILSLPYAREAAAALAARTGAHVMETDIPFGIEGTRRWVELVASRTDRRKHARRAIDRALASIMPRLERAVPAFLMGRRVTLFSDPRLAGPFCAFLADLGMRPETVVIAGRKGHLPDTPGLPGDSGARVMFEPSHLTVIEALRCAEPPADLVICNGEIAASLRGRMPVLEFGFPSPTWHALSDRAFLGFGGALNLVERMVNALA
jgi:nitrogenase molybdenum-iron protein alpha/beta subunit